MKTNLILFRNKHWDDYIYNLKYPSNLTKTLVSKAINEFWVTHIEELSDNSHVIALFRAQTDMGTYLTLGKLLKLNKSDKDFWVTFIMDNLDIKANDYNNFIITKIVISYGFKDGLAPIKNKKVIEPTKTFQNYRHYKLPVTMDPLKYGENPVLISKSLYIVSVTPLTIAKILVNGSADENHVDIIKSGNVVLSYKDKLIDDNTIERVIGLNKYIYIKDGNKFKLDLFKVVKPARRIKDKNIDKKLQDKIITLDIETYVSSNGSMIPYLITWFDGYITKFYYLTSYKNSIDMIKASILDLMKVKYNGYRIYVHNFAKFDSIFMLNELNKLGIVYPIINNNKIIDLSFKFKTLSALRLNNKKSRYYNLYFRDSFLLLVSSLKKLAFYFGVQTQKGIFPHRFVNESNLNYVGTLPAFEYFDNITLEEYNTYCDGFKGKNWCLKTESIKYCEADCVSLYQVINKFIKMIFDLYKINVNKIPTLPSLAYSLYRTHYLNKKVFVPMLAGDIYNNIKLSYTGGSTDMFIPTNNEASAELVYGYDINSLYPAVMKMFSMPVGKPIYFEGNIRKYDPKAFGFFDCIITAPNNLTHPIIQLHAKTNGGMRTVSPLGTFQQMLFSEEMDNAIKYGYRVEILRGYAFKKSNIFNKFVTNLYKLRIKYPKVDPMNYIHKIILNSTYGRFGMNDHFTESIFINKQLYEKYEKQNLEYIINKKSLADSYLVELIHDNTGTILDNGKETHNINVAISSAITAYARIYMSQFKNNPKLKLFYTDTDSIYTNLNPYQMNELYPGIINNKELGKLKLETVSSKAIFLSPKVYLLKSASDGSTIYKVKGLGKNILLDESEFESLLYKSQTITKSQDKWYKKIDESTIHVKNQIYTLQQTDNKRELIYDSNNKLIATKPYIINNGMLNNS